MQGIKSGRSEQGVRAAVKAAQFDDKHGTIQENATLSTIFLVFWYELTPGWRKK